MELESPPGNRNIVWHKDRRSGAGKSFFTNYLLCKRKDGACFGDNKEADIAYAYRYERVVIIDFARSARISYEICGVMEKLKNGRIFSSKYELV